MAIPDRSDAVELIVGSDAKGRWTKVFLAVAMILTVLTVQACSEDSDSGSIAGAFIDVPQTGQTISYAAGDDGEFQAGFLTPEPRFTDNGEGEVSDNLTGFVWTQDAGCVPPATWEETREGARNIADGQCSRPYGREYEPGDWRSANIRKLQSLQVGKII